MCDAADAKPSVGIPSSNPHVAQALGNSQRNAPFSRILHPDAPETVYRRRYNEKKSVIHWGQRKLLLSEIEFLTNYTDLTGTVVYAGAAPGQHIELLHQLFPDIKFILYDPMPFSPRLQDTARRDGSNVEIIREYFADETALRFKDTGVYFISDIRTCSHVHYQDSVVEKYIEADMCDQMRWHVAMRPAKSMLKFRLPWSSNSNTTTTEYLAGDVYLPVWGPQTTSETRLVPRGSEVVVWENDKYERQMFHFNTVTRVSLYGHDLAVGSPNYLDYCFDCKSEAVILQNYLTKHHQIKGRPCAWTADELCSKCSEFCSEGTRTLQTHVVPLIAKTKRKPDHEKCSEFDRDVSRCRRE